VGVRKLMTYVAAITLGFRSSLLLRLVTSKGFAPISLTAQARKNRPREDVEEYGNTEERSHNRI
jgi:hypothetical protein